MANNDIAARMSSELIFNVQNMSLEDVRKRTTKFPNPSIIDEMQIVSEEMWERDEEFRELHNATSNKDAKLGNLALHHFMIVQKIFDYARRDENVARFPILSAANFDWGTIKKISYVRRRRGLGVRQLAEERQYWLSQYAEALTPQSDENSGVN